MIQRRRGFSAHTHTPTHTHVGGGSPQAGSYKVILKGINRSERHVYTLAQIFGLLPPDPGYDLEHVTRNQSHLRTLDGHRLGIRVYQG